jgi:hypothetical protein
VSPFALCLSIPDADGALTEEQVPELRHGGQQSPTCFPPATRCTAGLALEPPYRKPADSPNGRTFTGATIADNYLWTGPNTRLVIGIADGSRAWFGGHTTVAANMATGAR